MWRSATSSDPSRRAPRRQFGPVTLAAVLAAAGGTASSAAPLTAEQALALAFPGCLAERRAEFLTPAQMAAAAASAGVPVESALVTRFTVRRGEGVVGTAYLDTHRVRTLAETLLVVLDAGGAVVRVEVLSFAEPPEYLPRAAWYAQLAGRTLDAELALARAVRPVAGATLTARATVEAVRRVLAVHRVLAGASP